MNRFSQQGQDILCDQFSRYNQCSEILTKLASQEEGELSVLDIGSGPDCLLAHFLTGHRITFVDPLLETRASETPAGCCIIAQDFLELSEESRAFDYSVAIDVLEHIPPSDRETFLRKASSLARKGTIIAFPSGPLSQSLDEYTDRIYEQAFGISYPWLQEHRDYGLPSLEGVTDFFSKEDWHVQVVGNGHIPWLEKLLPFIISVWSREETKHLARLVSAKFNEHLVLFDCLPPSYRYFVIATRREVPQLRGLDLRRDEADGAWKAVEEEIFASIGRLIANYPKGSTQEDSRRLNEMLREITRWAERSAADVALRDAEIGRLNAVTEKASEDLKRAYKLIRERDEEIQRLTHLLDEVTEWGKQSAREVEVRDRIIRELQPEPGRVTNES